jgi:aerobic carbon-monoxide dehydrogenase small subunit
MILRFKLNGIQKEIECPPASRLLDVLRNQKMTSVKEGCGEGECGACSILMDGLLVNSCLIPALQADGTEILTIDHAPNHPMLTALSEAFHHEAGSQCGICTPGMILASAALLMDSPNPCEDEIREGLSGNLCRCTGYVKIVASVQAAAAKLHDPEASHERN